MNHPPLLPSQELVLHQVSVDGFSPATGSVLKFPTSPLLSGSPFSPAAASSASTPAVSSPLNSSPTVAAVASIVRPQIRLREEWVSSLSDVDAFVLRPHALHTTSLDRRASVPVRYIADRFDRVWLSRRRVQTVFSEDGAVSVVRGKTGVAGAYRPSASCVSTSVLEDTFTALELAAHAHPEVPLERLSSYAKPLRTECDIGDEVFQDLHAYWLLRRNSMGGLMPAIPELRVPVREDNELARCHAAVLQDCPIPFKQRDWYVPVVERRRPASVEEEEANEYPESKRPRTTSGSALPKGVSCMTLEACAAYAGKALRLSRAMLSREQVRFTHTQLSLFELASLRHVTEEDQHRVDGAESSVSLSALSQCVMTMGGRGEQQGAAAPSAEVDVVVKTPK